jgi:hypothetical protein
MKRIVVLFIIVGLFFTGCLFERRIEELRVIRIDGCQYLLYRDSALIHKGDCDNPIHFHNRVMRLNGFTALVHREKLLSCQQ